MSVTSLEQSVLRVYLASVVFVSLSIVVVGGVVASLVVVRTEDEHALALAKTMRVELEELAAKDLAAIPELVDHELHEHSSFRRNVTVFRDGGRVAGFDPGTIDLATLEDGCSTRHLDGWTRVCAIRVDAQTTVVVVSPIAPMIRSVAPVIGAIGVVGLASALLFAALGRRSVRRRIAPLRALRERIEELPPDRGSHRMPEASGVSEIDALAQSFNRLHERIDRARERERGFAAHAGHELRTPITRLKARLELATEELRHGQVPEDHLVSATRSCAELERTTEALLALARSEASSDDAVDLHDVAEATARALEDDQRQRVTVEATDGVFVRGDETLIVLAASNLVENALKYATGDVRISVSAHDEESRLTIEDRGPGIPTDQLNRVREPFVRGVGPGQKERGVGLGLALVEHVVALHGAHLDLENAESGGLRATLRFGAWRPA